MEAKVKRLEDLKAWQKKKEVLKATDDEKRNKIKPQSTASAPSKRVPHFMQPTKSSLIRTGTATGTDQVKKTTNTTMVKQTGGSFASPNAKFTFTKAVPETKKVPIRKTGVSTTLRVKDTKSNERDKPHPFIPIRVQTRSQFEDTRSKVSKTQQDVRPKRTAPVVKRAGNDKTLDSKLKPKPPPKTSNPVADKKKIAKRKAAEKTAVAATIDTIPVNDKTAVTDGTIPVNDKMAVTDGTIPVNDKTAVTNGTIPVNDKEAVEKLPSPIKPDAEDSGLVTEATEHGANGNSENVHRSLGEKMPTGENLSVGNSAELKSTEEVQATLNVAAEEPVEMEADAAEMNKENIPPVDPISDLLNEAIAPPTNTVESNNEEAPTDTVEAENLATFTQPPQKEFQYVIDFNLKAEDGRVKDVPYFKSLIANYSELLEKLAAKWDEINNSTENSEDVQGEIRSVICKARLIISQKFMHFSELIYNCEYGIVNEGEGATLVSDLDGFWTMIYIQVGQIMGMFNNLAKIRSRGWKLEEAESETEVKPVAVKPKKLVKKTVKKSGPSKFSAFLAARQNADAVIKSDDVSLTQNEVEKEVLKTPPKTPLTVQRVESVRRSARIANKSVKKVLETKPIADEQSVDLTKITLEFKEDDEKPIPNPDKIVKKMTPNDLLVDVQTTPVKTEADKTAENVRNEWIRRSARIASKQISVEDKVSECEKTEEILQKNEFDFKVIPHSDIFSPCGPMMSLRPDPTSPLVDLTQYLGCPSPSRPPSRRVSFVRLQKSCSPSPNVAGAMMRAARIGKTSNQDRRETLYRSLLSQRALSSVPSSPSVFNTPTDLFNKLSLNSPQQHIATTPKSTTLQTTDDLLIFSPL